MLPTFSTGNRAMNRFARQGLSVVALSLAALISFALPCHGQQATGSGTGGDAKVLQVGDIAPDFTVTMVGPNGLASRPFRLSEHKGETVVLAFFPKARTAGCTVQMESYRDRYKEIFHDGKKVFLIGISVDADTALSSWVKDARFQFAFGSDTNRSVGVAYGASRGTGFHKRLLYVVDPSGRISYIAAPFNQMSADAYVDLKDAIEKSAARTTSGEW